MKRMQSVVIATAIIVLAGAGVAAARGGSHGHSHGHGYGHGHGRHMRASPANPSVPPSLTPDDRLTGTTPLPSSRQLKHGSALATPDKRDPEDLALDRRIRSICRGC